MPLVSAITQMFSPIQAKHLGFDTENDISASGNNSQANAYELSVNVNMISTCTAGVNDSIKLPLFKDCPAGWIFGTNYSGATVKLFPNTNGQFPATAVDTAINLTNGQSFLFFKDNGSSGLTTEYWMGGVF